MSQDEELHCTGFEPRASNLSEWLLFVSPLKIRFRTWAPRVATIVATIIRTLSNSQRLALIRLAEVNLPPNKTLPMHIACIQP